MFLLEIKITVTAVTEILTKEMVITLEIRMFNMKVFPQNPINTVLTGCVTDPNAVKILGDRARGTSRPEGPV